MSLFKGPSKIISAEDLESRGVKPMEFSQLTGGEVKITQAGQRPFKTADYLAEAHKRKGPRFQPRYGGRAQAGGPGAKEESRELTPEELAAQAQTEAEELRKQAAEEGRQAGYEAGLKAAEKKIEAGLADLERTVEEIGRFRGELLNRLEQDIVELVDLAARKVVAGDLALDERIVERLVAEALEHMSHGQWVTVHLNPGDLEPIQNRLAELTARFSELEGIELAVDPQVSPGGCRVESESEEVDAQIETRLQVMDELMERTLKGLNHPLDNGEA